MCNKRINQPLRGGLIQLRGLIACLQEAGLDGQAPCTVCRPQPAPRRSRRSRSLRGRVMLLIHPPARNHGQNCNFCRQQRLPPVFAAPAIRRRPTKLPPGPLPPQQSLPPRTRDSYSYKCTTAIPRCSGQARNGCTQRYAAAAQRCAHDAARCPAPLSRSSAGSRRRRL